MGTVSRTPQVLVVSAREHPAAVALEEHGYIVLRARAGAVALTKARQASPDALLLDGAALPDMEVLDLARKLHQAVVPAPDTPIFIIAPGPPTVPQHRAALRAGVCEFLLEPLDGDQLAAKLARRLLVRDAAAGAAVDPATGLYDVQGLARCARDLTRRAFNHRAPLACVVLAPEVVDADPADAAATQARVAKALKESGRQSDAFGRIGPNEFAIIAPERRPGRDDPRRAAVASRRGRHRGAGRPRTAREATRGVRRRPERALRPARARGPLGAGGPRPAASARVGGFDRGSARLKRRGIGS